MPRKLSSGAAFIITGNPDYLRPANRTAGRLGVIARKVVLVEPPPCRGSKNGYNPGIMKTDYA